MHSLLWIDEKPLRESLLGQLSEISKKLGGLRSQLDNYFSKDLPQYQSWVNQHFAAQLTEISQLEKKVCALGYHLEETVQLSLQTGRRPEELFAHWSKEEIVENLLKDEIEQGDFIEGLEESGVKKVVQHETRELYKRIVRRLHPDTRGELSEREKNLWVQAQRAYSQNDSYELFKIEQALSKGDTEVEPLSFSELLSQLEDFKKRLMQLESELSCLQMERAWGFSKKKNLSSLEGEITQEHQATLRDLKAKELHLSQTLNSWLEPKAKVAAKPRKKASRAQESLF